MRSGSLFDEGAASRWVEVIAAAIFVLLIPASATPAEKRSSLDPAELRRLLGDLDLDSGRLLGDVRRELERGGRWEPQGADLELWRALESFEQGAHRASRLYVGDAYPGMERDVRELLDQGWTVERELDRAEVDRRQREDWGRIRGSLQHLARSYGLEYGRGSSFGSYGDRGWAPEPDEREVRSVLSEIDRRSGTLASSLRGATEPKDIWKGVGESLLRDVTGLPPVAVTGRTSPEADVAELERIAADALRSLDATRRPSELRAEADSLLSAGRRIDEAFRRDQPSREVRTAWSELRASLDRLAALYALEPVSSEPAARGWDASAAPLVGRDQREEDPT